VKYLLVPSARAILLNPADPDGVLRYVTTARRVEVAGQPYIAVPHGIRETTHLRALGAMVPSPIGYYYNWPKVAGLHEPWIHQRETAGFLTLYPRCYCLNDMGTGKTYSALWAADYLMTLGLVNKVFVFSPLSTLDLVWGNSLFDTFGHRRFAILHGTAQHRRKMFNQDHHFYIINHDGFDIVMNEFREREDLSLVIIDELAAYRNHTTSRFKKLRRRLHPDQMVWGMTGSPMPNAPSDVWSQCKLVTPHTVDETFGAFRHKVESQESAHVWLPRKEAVDVAYRVMAPAIRFAREDCVDLPEVVYSDRHAEMTADQKRVYKEVATKLYAEWQGGQITAANAGVKLFKLVQVACGIVYDSEGREQFIGAQPRLDVLMEVIEEAAGKVIVFCPFRSVLNMVADYLTKQGRTVAVVHGDVSPTKRRAVFNDFQKQEAPDTLVADPGTMAHGLNLSKASVVAWFGPEVSNETYTQANARPVREGQVHKTNIVHIQGSPVERKIYKKLRERGSLQAALLELVAEAFKL
jgi:SNF2 family DNA or RNA helicase